ncbi:MAG: ABC transporter substrate-binding protein [Bacteroidetes bacterium]|nr:ABC transporter substrate-binding protein [Bacteroidota bacterium]
MIIKKSSYGWLVCVLLTVHLFSCTNKGDGRMPEIGFLDAFEDATISQARDGFVAALAKAGYVNDSTVRIKFLNAQGDLATLVQASQSMVAANKILIATNSTQATIAAAKQTKTIPIVMMVAPRPDIAGLQIDGEKPKNLFGVYEVLNYLDTSVVVMQRLMPQIKKVGVMCNQAESQSRDALEVITNACKRQGIELVVLSVSSSGEAQAVTDALLAKNIDAFFALPDNIIFSAFETISRSCEKASVPIFTSEAGLVARGALASYGANFYQWGYQAGVQAAVYLKTKNTKQLSLQEVANRHFVINKKQATKFGIELPMGFEVIE